MNRENQHRKRKALVGIGIVAALSACASAPKPTKEMASARTAIDAARQAGAQQDSSLAFAESRKLLDAAESHMAREEHLKAKRLAERALAKAEQARAEAELVKAEMAADEVESGLSVLRNQLK